MIINVIIDVKFWFSKMSKLGRVYSSFASVMK